VTTRVLRLLIVDDEPLARRRLRAVLAQRTDVVIVGEAEDVASAISAAQQLAPDVLLLDVRMPGGDGFDVIRALRPVPFVIIVSAHTETAVTAFDAEAVDFVPKPYDAERLGRALARAHAALLGRPAPLARSAHRDRIVVTTRGRRRFIAVADVIWFEAADNYVRLHLPTEQPLARLSLRQLESTLDPATWVRIHRSTIVRRAEILERRRRTDGEVELVMRRGPVQRVGEAFVSSVP
jgi:two-component system, LytTR family, response regulator